jgi:hypothetical protein
LATNQAFSGQTGVTPVASISGYSICPGFPREIAPRSTSARLCVNLKFTGPFFGLFTSGVIPLRARLMERDVFSL